MLEERLILSISYAVIAALLLVFCFYTNFTKKVKLISIFAVSLFYISSWKGYVGVLGWPTSEDLPDDFNILWVVIQEPNKTKSNEGELFLWIKEIDEFKKPIGDPRAFNLQWNKENHRIAQEALHKLQEGERLNGKKTYGVLNKDNKGEKSTPYDVAEGEPEQGRPSFEFVEVPPPELPPKTLILDQ